MTSVRDVPRHEYGTFLEKAEEWLEAAGTAGGAGAYNVAVSSCVHNAINASDAAAVMRLGKRSAGHHADAKMMIKSIFSDIDYEPLKRQFGLLPSIKNPAEYGGTMMTARQSADARQSAGRILEKMHAEIAR